MMLSPKVNVGDTVAMLPKSRRALTIQEIAALARSSLHGTHPPHHHPAPPYLWPTLSFLLPFAHTLGDCILCILAGISLFLPFSEESQLPPPIQRHEWTLATTTLHCPPWPVP